MTLTSDAVSEIVAFRPGVGKVTYYFGAAWEEEAGGIKDQREFKEYLDDTVLGFNNPIRTSF